MIHSLTEKILWLGILLGGAVTVGGLLAPWVPFWEITNHFRPFVWVGTAAMATIALAVSHRRLQWACGILFSIVSVLLLLRLVHAAPNATTSAVFVRIATFNLWDWNNRFEEIAAYVEQTGADIVVFQEVTCARTEPLFALLRRSYPHILQFPNDCFGQALLSKQPWLESGRIDAQGRTPLLVWARFSSNGTDFHVTGTHVAMPLDSDEQVQHVDRLIAHMADRPGPHIVAGDFNLTPFSWKLAKLGHATRLHRHATFLATWPTHWPLPLFLIDNILSTREFTTVRTHLGPDLGSDHRPLVVDLSLTPR